MNLYYLFILSISALINIHALPVTPPDSVYNNMKTIINDLKCPYLKTTKLFEPAPEFLLSCTNFSLAKSLTKLTLNNINQAYCLLYYNTFEQFCRLSSNVSNTSLQTILSNEVIDAELSAYQKNSKDVCHLLEKNNYVAEDIKPGIDTVYRYLKKECPRFCFDFDENLNPACALTAFLINRTMILQLSASSIPEPSKANIAKPYITEHNEYPHQGSLVEQQHVDDNNIINSINNLSDKHYAGTSTTNTNLEKLQSENEQPLAQPSDEPSFAITEKPTPVPTQKLQVDNINNNLQSKQQNTLSLNEPASSTTTKQQQGSQIVSQPNSNQESNVLAGSPGNLPVEETVGANTKQNVDAEKSSVKEDIAAKNNGIAQLKSKDNSSNEGIIEAPVQLSNGEKNILNPAQSNNEEKTKNTPIQNEKVENAKSTTKNDGEILLDGDPDDSLVIDKEIPEHDEQEEYNDDAELNEVKTSPTIIKVKPETVEENPNFPANYQNQNIDDSDSYFFSYFMMVCIMFICAYVAYHNKQKILALVVEGRKGRRPSRTRRPNSANYRKLDSNLEEAVTSSCNKNATHVIY